MFQRIDEDYTPQNTPSGAPGGSNPFSGVSQDFMSDAGIMQMPNPGTKPMGSAPEMPQSNYSNTQWANYGMPYGQQYGTMPSGTNTGTAPYMNMPAGQPMMTGTEGNLSNMYPGMTPMQNVMFYCPYMYTMPMGPQMQPTGAQHEMEPGTPTRQGGALPFLLYGLSGLIPPPYYGYPFYAPYPQLYPYAFRPWNYYGFDGYHHHYYRD